MESINGGPGQLETLSHESLSFLSEGTSSVLSRWPAFQMAIEKEWGGRDSRQKSLRLVSDLVSWFSQSRVPHHIADLENILDECMVLSSNADIEDGSIEEVAEQLMIMHEDSLQSNYDSIENLREPKTVAGAAVSQIRKVTEENATKFR